MAKYLRVFALLCIIGVAVVGGMYWIGSSSSSIPPSTVDFAHLSAEAHAALVARGQKVAREADCGACHSDPAGGSDRRAACPWSRPWGRSMAQISVPRRNTASAHGPRTISTAPWPMGLHRRRNLYPAMPYASYHQITRADSDALFAWLLTQPAVEKRNRPNSMVFPFNIRPAIALWNALERPAAKPSMRPKRRRNLLPEANT